jgi:hypothetical protein
MQSSKKKKKGKDSRSADVANAFQALGLEDEGGPADAVEDSAAVSRQGGIAAGTGDAAGVDEVAAVKPKGRKKKGKVDIGSAFAALGLEDVADPTAADMNGDSHGTDTAYSKANGHSAAAENYVAVDYAEPERESLKLNGAASLAILTDKAVVPKVCDRWSPCLGVCSAGPTFFDMLQVRRGRRRSPARTLMLCWQPWVKRQPALSKRRMASLLMTQQSACRKRQGRRRRTGSTMAMWMLCWRS